MSSCHQLIDKKSTRYRNTVCLFARESVILAFFLETCIPLHQLHYAVYALSGHYSETCVCLRRKTSAAAVKAVLNFRAIKNDSLSCCRWLGGATVVRCCVPGGDSGSDKYSLIAYRWFDGRRRSRLQGYGCPRAPTHRRGMFESSSVYLSIKRRLQDARDQGRGGRGR